MNLSFNSKTLQVKKEVEFFIQSNLIIYALLR